MAQTGCWALAIWSRVSIILLLLLLTTVTPILLLLKSSGDVC